MQVRYGTVGPPPPLPSRKGPNPLLLLLLSLPHSHSTGASSSIYTYVCCFSVYLSLIHLLSVLRFLCLPPPSLLSSSLFAHISFSFLQVRCSFSYAARFAQFRRSLHSLTEVLLLRAILSTGRSVKRMQKLSAVLFFSLFLLLCEGIRFPLSHFSSITIRVRI